tara:strand:- start:9171 stop:11390 length:2220 start_codon:yes stop_codon:yes gene_type:complete
LITDHEVQLLQKDKARAIRLGERLAGLIEQAVYDRLPFEARWLEDLRQINEIIPTVGKSKDDVFAQTGIGRANVFANISRPKTETAIAQFEEMSIPNDDKNWSISPTPVPEVATDMMNNEVARNEMGETVNNPETEQPFTWAEVAAKTMEEAIEKSKAMSRQIEDDLVQTHFNVVQRHVQKSAAIYGTGIIKGPIKEERIKKKWRSRKYADIDTEGKVVGTGQDWVLDLDTLSQPGAGWVDIWNAFPDLSARNLKECEYFLERSYHVRKSLVQLQHIAGINLEQLKEAIERGPGESQTHGSTYIDRMREINGQIRLMNDNRYEQWRYHGPVNGEDLIATGASVYGNLNESLDMQDAIIWMVGSHPIRAVLNPLDSKEWPYGIFVWEEDDTSIFGFGVPYRLRNPQRIMNTAWNMLLDHAGHIAGPQIVIDRRLLDPVDKQWDNLHPFKVWQFNAKEAGPNLRPADVFHFAQINSNQEAIANIYDMARLLMDEVSQIHTQNQGLGQQQNKMGADTLGGMILLQNQSSVTTRHRVQMWDDNIIKPIITRFYDYEMQFNENDEIKGDMEINPRGTSALLVKELQTKSLVEMAKLGESEVYSQYIKHDEILRRLQSSLRIEGEGVVKTEDDIAQAQQQAAQQAEKPSPEEELEEAKLSIESAKVQMKGEELRMMTEMALAKMQHEERMELFKRAKDDGLTDKQLQARLSEVALKEFNTNERFKAEVEIKIREGQTANYGLDAA